MPTTLSRLIQSKLKLKRNYVGELARRDPWIFITQFCYTLDSHDRKNPVKLFPKREFLRQLTLLWLEHPMLVVAKSRQMMATWLFVCLYLWEAITVPGRLIFLQSKREEDAIGNANAATGLFAER